MTKKEIEERDLAIYIDRLEGATLAKIGAKHGLCRQRIDQIVGAFGDSKVLTRQLARQLKAENTRVWNEKVAKAFSEASSTGELASKLNCSLTQINLILSKLGLSYPSRAQVKAKELGVRIRELRRLGRTYEEISKRVKVTHMTVWRHLYREGK